VPGAKLAVKIELEQLFISILDDPSVSCVMCEASFSSTGEGRGAGRAQHCEQHEEIREMYALRW
jgi:hypothetical protein